MIFFMDGLSMLGSAPTRIAGVLGCGLPIVANEGVGNVALIVRDNGVGLSLPVPAPDQLRTALSELDKLLQDADLPRRCRATGESVFSLHIGTSAYKLYDETVTGDGACAG